LAERERLAHIRIGPGLLRGQVSQQEGSERDHSLEELLRRPGVSYRELMSLPGAGPGLEPGLAAEQVEIQTKYQGYIDRQGEEIARHQDNESMCLPSDLDYRNVRGLSTEVQQKLNQQRPETVGQAGRISGVTPAAISLLLVHLKKGTLKRQAYPRDKSVTSVVTG